MADDKVISEIKSQFQQMTANLGSRLQSFIGNLTKKLDDSAPDKCPIGGQYKFINDLSEDMFLVHDAIGTEFAVKRIVLIDKTTHGREISWGAIRELGILSELRHLNIIRLERVFIEKDLMFLVFELLQCNLRIPMFHNRKRLRHPIKIKEFSKGILCGIQYCHSHGIMLRDLKHENIAITYAKHEIENDVIKLTEFSSAIRCVTDKVLDPNIGTLAYRPPEILMGSDRYSHSIDMWAFGCIFVEMLDNDKVLFRGQTNAEVLTKIFSILGIPTNESWPGVLLLPFFPHGIENSTPKDLSEIFPKADHVALDLLKRCLSLNPDGRISATQALAQPFLN